MDGKRQLSLELIGGNCGLYVPRGFQRSGRKGIARCESPLEEQLALAFADTKQFSWRSADDEICRVGSWDQLALVLLAQPTWGEYRVDFALADPDWTPPTPLRIVVEIDGHQFHERTQAQAEYDKRRDRFMVERGAAVLRFTGREVWRDPRLCAREVLAFAWRKMAA